MTVYLLWWLGFRAKKNLKLFCIFVTIFFLLAGCHTTSKSSVSNDLTREERIWVEDFLTGLMLQNRAIYTLGGSKPMTHITIHYHTDEEIQAYYDQMSVEEIKAAIYVKDYLLAQNWEKWEQIRSRFPMDRYKLYKKNDIDDPKFASIYFVDPLKVAHVILENYSIFRNSVGFDFDPFVEASKIEKGSLFWDAVNINSALEGILFGYGLKNSFTFHWKYWGELDNCSGFINCLTSYISDNLTHGKSTIKNLTLPAFVSFFKEDEIIEKYKRERKAIQEEYQGKNFVDLTLEKLISK
jgi:hypothetical protein